MPRVELPAPRALEITLSDALASRRSFHRGSTAEPFQEADVGTLLGLSLGVRSDGKRPYPSGGALYPVETYLVGRVIGSMPPGVFHYHPRAHALEVLWDLDSSFSTTDLTTTNGTPVGSALIVFTALWRRSSAKYGNLSYLHAIMEAGHAAQNILLVSAALSLHARPLAGFDDMQIAGLLDLDTRAEQPLYAVLIGTRTV